MKALLEQLQTSQAWLKATATPSTEAGTVKSQAVNVQHKSHPARLVADSSPIVNSNPLLSPSLSVPCVSSEQNNEQNSKPVTSLESLLAQLQNISQPPQSASSLFLSNQPHPTRVIGRSAIIESYDPHLRPGQPSQTRDHMRLVSESIAALTPESLGEKDVRGLSFQQALPLLAQLGCDPLFVAFVTQVRVIKLIQEARPAHCFVSRR